MTLLDDYQAKHKLEGVHIVSIMLAGIPKETLRRTGVHELIFTVYFLAPSTILPPSLIYFIQVPQNCPFALVGSRNSDPPLVNYLCVA